MIAQKNARTILRKLYGGEHLGAGDEIVENIKTDVATLQEVKEDWDKYEEAVEKEGIIYDQTPESPKTKALAAINKKRNKHWKEILRRLRFNLDSPAENVRAAADRLLFTMNSLGDVSKTNLFEETVSMRRIFNELKTTEAKADIALFNGLDELVDETEALNDDLHGKYDQRRKEWEKIKELGTLSDYRRVVDKLFFNVIDSINAVGRVNEKGAKNPQTVATIEKIRAELNSIFDQLLKNLRHRGIQIGGTTSPGDGGGGNFQKPDITNPPAPFE